MNKDYWSKLGIDVVPWLYRDHVENLGFVVSYPVRSTLSLVRIENLLEKLECIDKAYVYSKLGYHSGNDAYNIVVNKGKTMLHFDFFPEVEEVDLSSIPIPDGTVILNREPWSIQIKPDLEFDTDSILVRVKFYRRLGVSTHKYVQEYMQGINKDNLIKV